MKAPTTRDPTGNLKQKGLLYNQNIWFHLSERKQIINLFMILWSVSGPCSTTSPVISCPITQGLANGISPFITWRSEWQTPQAATNENFSIRILQIASTLIESVKSQKNGQEIYTLGFDENFIGFRPGDVKFFDGERLIGLPIHGSTHVSAGAHVIPSDGRRRRRLTIIDGGSGF